MMQHVCTRLFKNCLQLAGVACVGHSLTEIAMGSTVGEILGNLSAQFCGCTHVYGNIGISMEGLSVNRMLDENDFNVFYYLEQITGAFSLNGIPETTKIILPNLRIVRGHELLEGSYAMIMRNVDVSQIILPNLTEISQGSVFVEHSSSKPICNWASVNWPAIIDNGDITNPFIRNCRLEGTTIYCNL